MVYGAKARLKYAEKLFTKNVDQTKRNYLTSILFVIHLAFAKWILEQKNTVATVKHGSGKYMIYIFTDSFAQGKMWSMINSLTGVFLVWIQSLPSVKLVSIPRLKSPVYPAIYP